MSKIKRTTKEEILKKIIQEETQQKIKSLSILNKSKSLQYSTKTNSISAKLLATNPKKEILKVAFITSICLLIIVAALLINMQTNLLTQQAQKLTQLLHI